MKSVFKQTSKPMRKPLMPPQLFVFFILYVLPAVAAAQPALNQYSISFSGLSASNFDLVFSDAKSTDDTSDVPAGADVIETQFKARVSMTDEPFKGMADQTYVRLESLDVEMTMNQEPLPNRIKQMATVLKHGVLVQRDSHGAAIRSPI